MSPFAAVHIVLVRPFWKVLSAGAIISTLLVCADIAQPAIPFTRCLRISQQLRDRVQLFHVL
jgi:hypothetical protein